MTLEWWQYLLLALAGAGAGFIDAIAGGGGMIALPALLWAGLPPQIALGTNKLQSTCGTMLAVAHYWRAGLIRWRPLRLAAAITFAAAVAGAWAVAVMNPAILRRIVPVLLVVVAVYMALNRKLGELPGSARLGMTAFALIFVFMVLAGLVLVVVARTAVVVPQQSAFVVERLGRFSNILDAGFHVLIPFVDVIRYRHSLKESAVDIPAQVCITRDNVQVHVDGVLYMKVMNPERASYGVNDSTA